MRKSNTLALYGKYFSMHIKSSMQYKASFFLTILGQFLVSFEIFIGIYFMFRRFSTVRDFTYQDCLLCFSIVLMSFTLAECFFRGFDGFPSIIGNGEFDRILVRPRGLVFQVLGSRIEFTRIGRLLQAVVMMVYALFTCRIFWTPYRVLVLILMILGGVIVFSSLFLLYASICFFTLDGLEIFNILTDGSREFGRYPIAVYGKRVLLFCTYVVPFALFQYYPLLYLLGYRQEFWYGLLPILACLFVIPCYLFWRVGVRHYKSTGS